LSRSVVVSQTDSGSKDETDKSYNGSIETILKALKSQLDGPDPRLAPSVIFGTHNTDSVEAVATNLEACGLARRAGSGKLQLEESALGKVGIAQLYGE
jgi:proline dehydrogenase